MNFPNFIFNNNKKTIIFLTAGFFLLVVGLTVIISFKQKKAGIFVSATPQVWRIMPLGDSLTEGNYPGGIQSYRGYLRAKLIANNYTNIDFVGDRTKQAHGDVLPFDLNHAGHGGYTIGPDSQKLCPTCETTGLFEHIDQWLNVSNPDIILLLIGINDLVSAQNHPANYAQTAPDRLERLVVKIQQLRPNTVILLSSLLKTRESTVGWQKYDAVNNRARKIGNSSATDKVFFVDLNAVNLVSSDFWDNAHLNGNGARKLADAWYNVIIPFINDNPTPVTPTPQFTPVPTLTPTLTLTPMLTPTSTPAALLCNGGCYSDSTNCQKNCSSLCTRLNQSQVALQGCWSGAYRCCH